LIIHITETVSYLLQLHNMDNPQELKKAILKILAEKGDYTTILKHLDTDAKEEKGNRTMKLIEPISAFADMLTENSKGAFMEDLNSRLDGTAKKALEKLSQEISDAKNTLQNELQSLNWITTEYNNQNSPSTFYTVSGVSAETVYNALVMCNF
jgi:hypothetical protein